MEWVTLIGIIITVIVGPLLAYFLAKLARDYVAKQAAEKRQQEEQKKHEGHDNQVADHTAEVNQGIDAQREEREKWKKN